jgi:flagellar biosynthesis chaperone FliJ
VPANDSLARLLHLRTLEEEQRRAALDATTAALHRLRAALQAAHARERRGRESITLSSHSGSSTDRIAGLLESESAHRAAAILHQRIAAVEQQAAELHHSYLEKRTERRQVETLLREAEARQALDRSRREQQSLDNLFGARRHARQSAAHSPSRPIASDHEIKIAQEMAPVPEAEPESNL